MKKLTLLLTIVTNLALAQVKNGEAVPDINFKTILNAPVKTANLSNLKGKIVLIDFWATWCGSCIVAMPHLQQLQKKYPGKLQIITVTDETVKRTGQFLTSRPSNLWFAVDTARAIAQVFPHQLIPHDVLISADGKLIANTSPESVTDKVIDSLLNNQEIHLAEKEDNTMDYEEIIKKYFFAADTVKTRFSMMPEIKGAPGLSTTWMQDSTFKGRRLTCLNLGLTTLYRLANGDFPFSRMVDKTEKVKNEPVYCLDIIAASKADLLPMLRNELAKRFDLQARVEQQNKEAYVLKIKDPEKFKSIPLNTSGNRTYYSRHGEIDQQDMTMADFAEYLESYGIAKLIPVIDETKSTGKFDIKFSFQPENPASLTQILTDMGLSLEKQQRKVDMLVVYKAGV
ncbi:TIGR03435 family protein [Mucilaginibacter sp.]|uniref:TIGR03435 family protein n=1 Tax=Mucilaginibacter sp. TaxID=1882438 RepID=UPI0025F3D8F1|nr:TIGR03435 family protein [Mucilaginibacter sp.]